MQHLQQTQTNFSKVQIEQMDNLKKVSVGKSYFASQVSQISGSQIPNGNIKCSMKVVNNIKRQSKSSKQNTNILQGDSCSIVRIKPKKNPSIHGQQNNVQKSGNQSIQPLQKAQSIHKVESKPKRMSQLKQTQKKIQFNQTMSRKFRSNKLIQNPRNFLLRPVLQNQVTKCQITRYSSLFQNTLLISLKGESKLLLAYEKVFKLFGSQYLFKIPETVRQNSQTESESMNQKMVNPLLGRLQGNFDGSIFNVYQYQCQKEEIIATIQYQSDVGKLGNPRKITIYTKDTSIPTHLTNLQPHQNLKSYLQTNPSSPQIRKYQTMQPIHNKQTDQFGYSFGLKFPIQPSVHNTVIVDADQKPVLKFFKTEDRAYGLHCFHPISVLVAGAFVVSSFGFKIVSQ